VYFTLLLVLMIVSGSWVYAFQREDQVVEKFKEFLAFIERQLRKRLKCIRNDNGGEYRAPFDVYGK